PRLALAPRSRAQGVVIAQVDARDHDTVGPEHPGHLAERDRGPAKMLEDGPGPHDIELGVAERQGATVVDPVLDARLGVAVWHDVDGDAAAGAVPARGAQDVETLSGAELGIAFPATSVCVR